MADIKPIDSWQGLIAFMESEIQVNVHHWNPGWTMQKLIRRHCEMGSIIAIMKWLERSEYANTLYAGLSHYTLKICVTDPHNFPMIILNAVDIDEFAIEYYESHNRRSYSKKCNSQNLRKCLFPLLERLRSESQQTEDNQI